MIFVKSGETDTEDAGKKEQPDAADAINIKRKRNCYCEKKIFGHVCSFSYVKMNIVCFIA